MSPDPDRSGYRTPDRFARTQAEREDQLLSWNRSDEAFFAAGACHILAFRLVERDPGAGRQIICLEHPQTRARHHVYVVDGDWAFDFDGWTPEVEVLAAINEHQRSISAPELDRVVVHQSQEVFCQPPWSRPAGNYAFDPIPRADAFIDRFPISPPRRPGSPGAGPGTGPEQ